MRAGPFLDDAPKAEPEEDRLNYAPFARRLASALASLRAPTGYVVGVQAPWGSGKSTALNFVKAYLAEAGDEQLFVVDYAPWLISGHQDLVAAFFKVLAEAMDVRRARREDRDRGLAKHAANLADPAVRAAGELAAALVPGAGLVAKPTAKALGAAAKAGLQAWAAEPSLQAKHDALRRALRDGRRRYVVFIDDLDRLDREEIRAIAQMVKSVGSLPNVIYALAYDRGIVRDALDATGRPAGVPAYDEKIVQHEVSLPIPSRRAMMQLLESFAGDLLKDIPDDERWRDLLRLGVHRWLRSARDVVRLVNGLTFTHAALDGDLDGADILAMEGLRLFDPIAFAWVRDHRDWLLSEGNFQLIRKEDTEAAVRRLHDALPAGEQRDVIGLLATLFPTRSAQLLLDQRPVLSGTETYAQVAARRGIATSIGFNAYFSQAGGEGTVAKADVDAMMATLDDRNVLDEALADYLTRRNADGDPLIGAFLDELRYRFEAGAQVTQSLLNALLSIGEPVMRQDDLGRGFGERPLHSWHSLLATLLQPLDVARAGGMLRCAFAEPLAASVAAEIYVDRGRELEVFPRAGSSRPLITRADFDALGCRVLELILAEHAAGTLQEAPRFWNIVRAWKHLGDPHDAKAWLRAAAEASAEDFAKVAAGHLAYSISARSAGYVLNRSPAEEEFTRDELLALARRHDGATKLTPGAAERLTAFREGLESLAQAQEREHLDPAEDVDRE